MVLDSIKFCEGQRSEIRAYHKEEMREFHVLIQLFQTMPGVGEDTAIQLLGELNGGDLSKFEGASKLASWLGICPGNNESGGKRKFGHIRHGNGYIRVLLFEAALAAVRCKDST